MIASERWKESFVLLIFIKDFSFVLLLISCSEVAQVLIQGVCEHPQSKSFLLILYILVYLEIIYKAKPFLGKDYVTL